MATATRRSRDDGFGRSSRFYEVDGDKFPSVTTLLQAVNKPMLLNWAAKTERDMVVRAAADLYEDLPVGAKKMSRMSYIVTLQGDGSRSNYGRLGKVKAHVKELEKAANLGQAVHELIEWNLRRELKQECGPEPKVPPAGMWAFMAYEDWRKSANLVPILIEQTVYSKRYGYAGTADLMCEIDRPGWRRGDDMSRRVHVVLDWKTGKGIYSEALLQNAAYVHAATEMDVADPGTAGLIVRLPKTEKDPEFETRFIPGDQQKRLFKTFLHVMEVWKFLEEQECEYQEKRAATKPATKEEDLESTLRASISNERGASNG